MDPHANIARQRELAAEIQQFLDLETRDYDPPASEQAASELTELVLALDEWRLKGGFDPYAPPYTDAHALDEITAILSGNEWDSDTPVAISEVVRKTGREVADAEEEE